MKKHVFTVLMLILAISCGSRKANNSKETPTRELSAPAFCADSAFNYIKIQTDFGPRVPNTEAQVKCAAWLMKKLGEFGAQTFLQGFESVTFDKTKIRCYNIIGSYNPDSPTRIILCSHWDSRPWADNDPDPANHKTPIDGANDGASGTPVFHCSLDNGSAPKQCSVFVDSRSSAGRERSVAAICRACCQLRAGVRHH